MSESQTAKDCDICSILESQNHGQDVIVLQTERWRAVLDHNQQYLGKMFVTLLEHKEALSELDMDDWQDFDEVVKSLERAVKAAYWPNHFNWSCLMNIAAMKGDPTHVHWHLHPRYQETRTVNCEEFIDTNWYPRKDRTDHIVSIETLSIIASDIRHHI